MESSQRLGKSTAQLLRATPGNESIFDVVAMLFERPLLIPCHLESQTDSLHEAMFTGGGVSNKFSVLQSIMGIAKKADSTHSCASLVFLRRDERGRHNKFLSTTPQQVTAGQA